MDVDQTLVGIAHDLSDLRVAVARIEEQLSAMGASMEELEDQDTRVEALESAVQWAKAWSAGAAAAVVGVFGALAWLAANMRL